MRVLFATLASTSHVATQVPLAWAMRAAGHDVRMASQPDVTEYITAAGLTAVPIGEPLVQRVSVDELRRRQEKAAERLDEPPDAEELMRIADDQRAYTPLNGLFTVMTSAIFQNYSAIRTVDDLVAFSRHWRPDLVVWDTMLFAAPVAAVACGAAHARLLYGLDLIGHRRQSFRAAMAGRDPSACEDALAEWLDWTAARHGGRFTEDLVVGQWTIDVIPPSIRLPVDLMSVPMRYVPYNGAAVVPDWLREPPSRPRVCLTLGTSFREVMGGDRVPVAALLEALAGLDVEVVATLTEEQLASTGAVPGNVRVVAFVPLDELLPTCSAVVHHGGFGTGHTALAHGVPQVILPTDHWDVVPRARAIADTGAALAAQPATALGPDEVRTMVSRVLDDPTFARGAAAGRAELRALPAPADLVTVLERLSADHRC